MLPPFVGILVQALVLGLFCSSIMSNALLAAVTSIGLTVLSWVGVLAWLDEYHRGARLDPAGFLRWTIGITLASLIVSVIAFAWTRGSRRVTLPRVRLPFRFQSPIVVTRRSPARTGSEALQVLPSVATPLGTPAPVSRPVSAGVVSSSAWAVDQPRPRSRFAEFRYLAWETMREGGRTWFLLAAIGLVVPWSVFAS